jgi:hypothetical protein
MSRNWKIKVHKNHHQVYKSLKCDEHQPIFTCFTSTKPTYARYKTAEVQLHTFLTFELDRGQ